MRARATPDWDADEMSVELILLVDPSTMPQQPADEEPPLEMLEQITDLDAQRLAERLDSGELSPGQRIALWQRLGDAWCSRTKPCGCIREVTTIVVPITEFSRADELECPELDLDYLSG